VPVPKLGSRRHHKYFKACHPGRDCRDPEAMDGDTEQTASIIMGIAQ